MALRETNGSTPGAGGGKEQSLGFAIGCVKPGAEPGNFEAVWHYTGNCIHISV